MLVIQNILALNVSVYSTVEANKVASEGFRHVPENFGFCELSGKETVSTQSFSITLV